VKNLFVALELPQEMVSSLVSMQEMLRSLGMSDADSSLSFQPSHKMHLTLLFVKEIDLVLLEQSVRSIVANKNRFELLLNVPGYFERPSVLWISPTIGAHYVRWLHERLATHLGLPLRITPHVTLAKYGGKQFEAAAAALNREFKTWPQGTVSKVSIMRKDPNDEQRYSTLSSFELSQAFR
jgi:2'-5' RNA ligase